MPPGLADHPDYEIRRELGRGGMGVVYLAHNRLLGRDEVLKVMGRHLLERSGVADRFLREIRAVARLRHENIVAAYTAFRLGESLVFAMEYVEGYDLSRLVKSRGPLPVDYACKFIQQAALGLQHAHEHGLVHRDIKPANLMLAREKNRPIIKVLDFGLSKATRESPLDGGLTHAGQMLGTPDYIAPEQTINAQGADIRADIYSLGCTLYYLLSGGPPFHGTNLYDILQAHHSMDAKPLNFVRPEVPVELAMVADKMMAKDPARRFQVPKEVADALAPFYKKGGAGIPGAKPEISLVGPSVVRTEAGAASPVLTSPTTPVDQSPAPMAEKSTVASRPESKWASLLGGQETESSGAEAATVGPARRPPWVWPSLAAGVLLLGLILAWSASVLRVRTPEGDIIFDGLPEQAVVTVDQKVCTVEWPGDKSPAKVTVPSGEHKLKIELNGLEIHSEEVKIAVGDKQWIRVRLTSPERNSAKYQPSSVTSAGGSSPSSSGRGGCTESPAAVIIGQSEPASAGLHELDRHGVRFDPGRRVPDGLDGRG